jgi:hypothetical protein
MAFCRSLLFLEIYQAAENSTYPENINTLSPSSRPPASQGPDSQSWGATLPCSDIQTISAIFRGVGITAGFGKLVIIRDSYHQG